MVAGFNTDITHNGVAFHVQTELRKEPAIETTVYVGGAIVHTVRTPFQTSPQSLIYEESKLRQCLEQQHREVIAQVRSGKIQLPFPR